MKITTMGIDCGICGERIEATVPPVRLILSDDATTAENAALMEGFAKLARTVFYPRLEEAIASHTLQKEHR